MKSNKIELQWEVDAAQGSSSNRSPTYSGISSLFVSLQKPNLSLLKKLQISLHEGQTITPSRSHPFIICKYQRHKKQKEYNTKKITNNIIRSFVKKNLSDVDILAGKITRIEKTIVEQTNI